MVDLYSTTPPATAQMVEHLGCPTRQCNEGEPGVYLEVQHPRWPCKSSGPTANASAPAEAYSVLCSSTIERFGTAMGNPLSPCLRRQSPNDDRPAIHGSG